MNPERGHIYINICVCVCVVCVIKYFITAERAVLVIARMSSFPVQTRGIESES